MTRAGGLTGRRTTWAAGVAVCAAMTLGACSSTTPTTPTATTTSTSSSATSSPSSSSTSSGSTTSSPTTSATSATPAGRTLAVTVTGSTVSPAPAQVDLPVGQTLTLVVTSDHADELHVHGFEVEVALKPGVPASVTLTGKDQGVFEVETHNPALTLLTIAVR